MADFTTKGSFNLGNQITLKNKNSNIDRDYGPYENQSLQDIATLLADTLQIGKTIGIIEDGVIVEYWWQNIKDDKYGFLRKGGGEVDSILSTSSSNPIQNKTVANAFADLSNRQDSLEERQDTLESEADFLRGFHDEYLETKELLNNVITVCGYNNVPTFNETATYLENSLVFRDGKFWRFTKLHNPGAWSLAEVVETSLYSEIQNMRNTDVEQVLVHLSVFDNASIDWTQLSIDVTVENEPLVNIPLDTNGEATFSVLKGKTYTIDYPSIDGYQLKADSNHKALVNVRTITHEYRTFAVAPEDVVEETITAVAHVYNCNATRYTTHAALVAAGLESLSPYGKTVELSVDAIYDKEGNLLQSANVQTATYDENLRATFPNPVPYGVAYTVRTPDVIGTTKKGTIKKGISDYPAAYFYFSYTRISTDIRLFDTDGVEYEITTLADQTDEIKTHLRNNGVIRIENSTLAAAVIDSEGNTGAGFYLKFPLTYKSKQWASANVEFDTKYLPFITNGETGDYKGQQNTHYIRMIGDGTEGGTGTPSILTETPAADYCENPNFGESVAREDSGTNTCCPALYIQGELYPSYQGGISQWAKGIRDNSAALLAIQYDLLCNGLEGRPAAINFASGYWWSSSQRIATNSWSLYSGSLLNGIFKTTTSICALPFYDLHPIAKLDN